jgi:hypothetical protein
MMFTVKRNYCNCHPETCACNDWAVYDGDKKLNTFFHEQDATIYALTLEENRLLNVLHNIKY